MELPYLDEDCETNLRHAGITMFLAATKQLNEWYFLSVCPFVTPFSLCSHHLIIMKFSGVITNDQSKVHSKGQRQRSKSISLDSKFTENKCKMFMCAV